MEVEFTHTYTSVAPGDGSWIYVEVLEGSYEWTTTYNYPDESTEVLTQSGIFGHGFLSFKNGSGRGYYLVDEYEHQFSRTGQAHEVDNDSWTKRNNLSVSGTDYFISQLSATVTVDNDIYTAVIQSEGNSSGSFEYEALEEFGTETKTGDYEKGDGTHTYSKQTGRFEEEHSYELEFTDNFTQEITGGSVIGLSGTLSREGWQTGFTKVTDGTDEGFDKERTATSKRKSQWRH